MVVDWFPLWLSLRVAAVATLVSLPAGWWLAWRLARAPRRWRDGRAVAAAMPPTVLGGYAGALLAGKETLGLGWTAAVAAALLEAVPLMVLLGRAALESVEGGYELAARSLGASGWRVFWRVSLPLARWPMLVAVALTFARVLGDFGLTLLVAGFAVGRGGVLDATLRRAVESGDGGAARILVVTISAVLTAALVLGGGAISRRARR